MQLDKLHSIVDEWNKIFSRLRALHCTAGIYSLHLYTGHDDITENL